MEETKSIRPQPGFQEAFLSSPADIVIGGGAAGAGKTYAELLEALRHKDVPKFNAIIFRRTTVQIQNPGGPWDESSNIYPFFEGRSNSQKLTWVFPKGALIKFSHLEHEKNIYDHQGAQYCLIIFDELTHFTKKMFFYMLSRNRSVCGVSPYIRATCNPDPDSFVAELIDWWIDQEEKLPDGNDNPRYGFPIPERAGVLRYFMVEDDSYVWGNTREEVVEKCAHIFENPELKDQDPNKLIKSITFIPGEVYGNRELLSKNPEYLANLLAQDPDEQLRLLRGNWKQRIDPDCIFNYVAVENMFDNNYPANTAKRYITCDAARLGDDLCTIWVWYGWKVVHLEVLTTSLAQEVVDRIEELRRRFDIVKGHVAVDQDGVGGGVVKLGRYVGFSGGTPALAEPGTFIKEYYFNLKTQCYYRYAIRVNDQEVSIALTNENVRVDGYFGTKIKLKGKIHDVRELIKQDHRAIKKKNPDDEGKKRINSKAEQKILLRGRSPDFSDGLSIREFLELRSGNITSSSSGGRSILDSIQ